MLIPQELQLSRFRPLDYACLSVELLQSPTVDCIVRYRRPYSPLQWTVRSAVVKHTDYCRSL